MRLCSWHRPDRLSLSAPSAGNGDAVITIGNVEGGHSRISPKEAERLW